MAAPSAVYSADLWSVEKDDQSGNVSLSTTAIKGDYCRTEPSSLQISCQADQIKVTVNSGCEPSKVAGRDAHVIFTHVYNVPERSLHNRSSSYPLFIQDDKRTLTYADDYTVNLVADIANHPTLGIDIGYQADGLTPYATSHFDTSELAQKMRDADMQCGILELLAPKQ